ncbi:MAG: cell division protein FtsW [Alphaproteobacteria bacterium]|nr:cell division protein FtsW [Alphaproteobacteria bacterium]NDC56524.1 cell division protein FtsW [Alphaproteobacteria bacterium]NDG03862.1 cell division protein FtsW [Alphaproteobacteria bacterium]
MNRLARYDQSPLGRWWWTVDRWTLALLTVLIGLGLMLVQASTPAIAAARDLPNYHFIKNQLMVLLPGLLLLLGVSMTSPRSIRIIALFGFLASLLMLIAVIFWGQEVKGATRWLVVPLLGTFQPSEVMKPFFIVTAAWLFARHTRHMGFPALETNIIFAVITALLLLAQPDVGMTMLVMVVWFGQFTLAGLPLILLSLAAVLGAAGVLVAYHIFPHVASRIDRFIDPASGDTYQVDRALEAFSAGGLWGKGPGEGTVKMHLPDAHADFVFAVAGEELGLFWCLVIVAIYVAIIARGLWRLRGEKSLFITLAVGGLLAQFGVQALINMASALHLGPTKGMTLPFISYGGSSLLSMCILFGMLLGLTRKRYDKTEF